MEYFYLVGIKIDGKLVHVSNEPITLLEAKDVKKNLDTPKTKYVVLRCCELESE